jgi:5'-nucleotidase / UDP-sugar diphosphatase
MKNWKRFVPIFLATLILLVPISAVFGVDKDFDLTVLSTNDTHGQPLPYAFSGALEKGGTNWNSPVAGGLAARKTYVDQVRAAVPNLLVLDAGDVDTGNILSNLFQAKPDILGMNLIGYNAMALGNHEFDVSQQSMLDRKKDAAFPFLSANTYVKATGKRLVDPYVIVKLPGANVAVIGLTTIETPTAVMPANVASLEFRDPAAEVKALLPEVRAKSDFVIVLSHLGLSEDKKLADAVPGIDLIIGGHSHTYMASAETVGATSIFQAYTGGVFVGRVDLKVAKGKVASVKAAPVPINLAVELKDGQTAVGTVKEIGGKKYDFVAGYLEPDPAVVAMLKPFQDQVSKDMDTVIGAAKAEFAHTVNGVNLVRHDDGALGNMICDAMREATSDKIGKKVDVFLQNGGGIRAPIPAGQITKKTIYTVLPFDNTIMTAQITGAQLLELLNKKVLPDAVLNYGEKYASPAGSFLQVSGMSYTIDIAAKTVSDVKVSGAPLDAAKTYLMATQNFMMSGGDGYAVLATLANPYSTSMFQRDMVIEWVVKKANLDPAAYEDNRINLLNTGH